MYIYKIILGGPAPFLSIPQYSLTIRFTKRYSPKICITLHYVTTDKLAGLVSFACARQDEGARSHLLQSETYFQRWICVTRLDDLDLIGFPCIRSYENRTIAFLAILATMFSDDDAENGRKRNRHDRKLAQPLLIAPQGMKEGRKEGALPVSSPLLDVRSCPRLLS